MKKFATLFIVLMMIVPILIGCTTTPLDNNNDDSQNNTLPLDFESTVKLLLAEERLNSALLKNQGNVFDNGIEVMHTLANKAIESIDNLDNYRTDQATVKLLNAKRRQSSVTSLNASEEQVIFDNEHGGGKVTFDGENYLFSDFVEVSNSYDSFSLTANHIASMAEAAASLIDSIKKHVRIVDKWVLIAPDMEYYLHVGENEEILYERSTYNYKICRRYLNEEGNNVYEFL